MKIVPIKTEKSNEPNPEFEVPYSDYEKNIWFVTETWKNLQAAQVPNIYIHIESGPVPPIGSIAWVNSKLFPKSSIPVAMNQYHSEFKKLFRKAGGRIFREINYKPDIKSASKEELLDVDLFKEMRGIDYNSLKTPLPYDRSIHTD